MTAIEKQTKIDALNLLRRFHSKNGDVEKVAEIDEQLSKIPVEAKAEPVEKPKPKRQTKTVK